MRLTRLYLVGIWVMLGVLCLVLAVVRLAQERWRDAAILSGFTVATLAFARYGDWWVRRAIERPVWARNLSADELGDPQRRNEAWRRSPQVRFTTWTVLLVCLGGGVWAVAMSRWGLLIWSAIGLVCGLRVLRQIYVEPPQSEE